MKDSFWPDEAFVQPGEHVMDRRDGCIHLVLETFPSNSCTTPCDSYACRCAFDWKAGEKCSAPRWKVEEPVNCLDCIARGA